MRQLLCAWIVLGLASPALATIVVFGHHQGLNGQSTSPPGDQVLVYDDFFRFVDAFDTAQDARQWDDVADLNGDGQVDFDDFFDFI